MRRVAILGILALVAFLGSCSSSSRSGAIFGIPDGTLGEIRIIIGSNPTCSGGTNDGAECDPNGDCPGFPDAFCVEPTNCHGDLSQGQACATAADCIDTIPVCDPGTKKCQGDIGNGDDCLVDADCPDVKPTCDPECDRGTNDNDACSLDTDCPGGGACTTGRIHAYEGLFTYEGDLFFQDFAANDTDGDNDGFTPANLIDTGPLGGTARLQIRFPDGFADCVRVTWGAQRLDVLPLTCGVGGGPTRDEITFEIRP